VKDGNMQTPIEIDFRDIDQNPELRAEIAERVAELEQRYGRMTACRVVVRGPGGRHHTGGLYEINLRLALPNGREVNISHTAQADERHSDLQFALHDAFKRARRRLQEQVRRLQGRVKPHEGQPTATVPRGMRQ
jgi:ribosome-associated translation inhibitor RaiA